MDLRPLARTGIRVAPLALGCMNFGDATPEADAIRIIHKALDLGVNLLDTADVYNGGLSETVVGKALEGRRDDVILATKFHFPTSRTANDRGNSRRHILDAVEASLRRLGTDRIDLYQVHRPDLAMDQKETLRALNDLVTAGKVRYIGCSTHPAWKIMEAHAICDRYGWSRFVTEQPPYNLLDRRVENEIVPFALRHDVSLIPWSPLAMGLLAGRYDQGAAAPPEGSRVARLGSVYKDRVNDHAIDVARRIADVAGTHDMDPAALALAWVRDRPAVLAPIVGPRTEAHLDVAIASLDITLTEEVTSALDAIVPPGTHAADFLNNSGWTKPARPLTPPGSS